MSKLIKLVLIGDEEINKMKQMIIFEREYSENTIKGFRQTCEETEVEMTDRKRKTSAFARTYSYRWGTDNPPALKPPLPVSQAQDEKG